MDKETIDRLDDICAELREIRELLERTVVLNMDTAICEMEKINNGRSDPPPD